MKLTPLLTKIAASLFIAAKAVKGQQYCDGIPEPIASLDDPPFAEIKKTWCALNAADPTGVQPTFFTLLVGAILVADPSGAFFGTCLPDVMEGMLFQQQEVAGGDPWSFFQCDDTKTKVYTLSTMTIDYSSYTRVIPWELEICKADYCDTDVLNEVLNAIALEYFELGLQPFDEGTTISDTITPTYECMIKQTGELMNSPEAFCSGESAPECSNKKLIEVQFGTDAPFELAICDDNDCLASLKDARPLEIWIDGFNSREIRTFCLPPERFSQEFTNVEITILEKEFNLSDYCSAAAASGRTGRCYETPIPTQAPTVKVSAPAESAAWMTMESFVLKCFVGLIPLLLL